MFAKYNPEETQASVSLRINVPLIGFDKEPHFTLIYGADILGSGTNISAKLTTALTQDQLNGISRNANTQIRTLSLKLKEPCPILSPLSLAPEAKDGSESHLHRLVRIAAALEVHVVYDENHVRHDQRATFTGVIKNIETLRSPKIQYSKPLTLANWTLFSPIEDVAPSAPPSYSDASRKRHRQGESLIPEPFY